MITAHTYGFTYLLIICLPRFPFPFALSPICPIPLFLCPQPLSPVSPLPSVTYLSFAPRSPLSVPLSPVPNLRAFPLCPYHRHPGIPVSLIHSFTSLSLCAPGKELSQPEHPKGPQREMCVMCVGGTVWQTSHVGTHVDSADASQTLPLPTHSHTQAMIYQPPYRTAREASTYPHRALSKAGDLYN